MAANQQNPPRRRQNPAAAQAQRDAAAHDSAAADSAAAEARFQAGRARALAALNTPVPKKNPIEKLIDGLVRAWRAPKDALDKSTEK